MAFNVFFHLKAKQSLEKLDLETQKKIKNKIKELKQFPKRGKHLNHMNFWRLRVGDYRIIYEIDEDCQRIIVLFIGHRKNVHVNFSRIF